MNNRLLDDDHDDDESLLAPGLNQQQKAFNNTQASQPNRKWWNLKKDRKSHVVCWMMVLGSGLLLTAIGIVSMVLLVIYSPTPKEILNGTSPITEKQWKEIVLETFGVLSGFVIGIGIVLSVTPLICSCYILNPKEFQIPGIHTEDDDDDNDGL